MDTIKLQAKPRTAYGKGPNRRLRTAGLIPATVYGPGETPVSLAVEPKRVVEILGSPRGRNTPVSLQIEGETSPRLTMIRDFQVHPWKRTLVHLDLWQVAPDRKVVIQVPFETKNIAEIERTGARVHRVRKEIQVECAPEHIPAAVVFDMASCPTEMRTYSVTEIPMPNGVSAVFRSPYGLVQVREPKAALPEETAVAAAEGAAPAEGAPAAASGATAGAAPGKGAPPGKKA
jgi:large subunit ribosomal protein L25